MSYPKKVAEVEILNIYKTEGNSFLIRKGLKFTTDCVEVIITSALTLLNGEAG